MSETNQLPPSLERLAEYIGRETAKKLLRSYASTILAEPRCYLLYFEADGGLGKTRLLQLFPHILQEQAPAAPPAYANLRAAQLVDFYSFQNRDPNVIERQLIEGLKRTDANEWYRLPGAQVDAIFAPYDQGFAEYQQVRESGNEERTNQSMAALRATFVACWNRLAATHPLVMCFDTLETLFFRPAPPEALVQVGSETAGIDLVMAWMRSVLPQLQHTLVLLSGRPVADNVLARQLNALGLLAEPVQRLQPFETPAEIRAYLAAYQCTISDDELPYIQQVTEGRPLLLTCFAETRRTTMPMPPVLPGMPTPEECASRPEFEDWLVGTLLNPMVDGLPLPDMHDQQNTLAYCLYFLVYARRGIPREELTALFAELGLPCHSPTIENIHQTALVKGIGNLLFLHDEIFVMIDSSGKPDEFGLREPTLNHLCATSRQAVQWTDQASLLGSMANNMYYELTRDFEQGYRAYTIYIDRLLSDRNINATLVLSDAFWRTLNYRITINQQESYPYRDAMLQSPVDEARILRDEEVRQVKLLRARDQNWTAVDRGSQLFDKFGGAGIIPSSGDILAAARAAAPAGDPANQQGAVAAALAPIVAGKDLYLFVDLGLTHASASAQVLPLDHEQAAETLYASVITLLEQLPPGADDLLNLRRWYFLGRAYMMRGYLRRLQQRFAEAQQDAEEGRAAYKRYREMGEAELNDHIVAELAQVMNNLAYSLAQGGNLKRALRLSNEIISDKNDYIHHASDYQRALFYNTNGLIHIRSAQYLQAEGPIQRAEQAARNSQRHRARGLVAWARAQLEMAKMKASRQIDLSIEQLYRQAVESLKNEPNMLRELFYSWSSYARSLAQLYREADAEANSVEAERHDQRALALLDEALRLLPDGPSIHRADSLVSKATLCNMRGDYGQARALLQQSAALLSQIEANDALTLAVPEYGQIISGRIALQYADIALHTDASYAEALRQMAIALARAYVFAEKHGDQETFERLIDQFIEEIPGAALAHLRAALAAPTFAVDATSLPYQQPDAAAWATAWQASLLFLEQSVTTRLLDI